MTATFVALPLTREHRHTLPALVVKFCDLEAQLHAEKGWKPFTPTLLIQGYRPEHSTAFPIAPRDKDVVAFLDRFATAIRNAPPPAPVEAVVLVLLLRPQTPNGTTAKARLLVGALGSGDLFTMYRAGANTPLLTWAPEPGELLAAAHPYTQPLTDLISVCAAHG